MCGTTVISEGGQTESTEQESAKPLTRSINLYTFIYNGI